MSSDAIDHLKSDPDLRPVVEEHGELPIEPADDPFQRFTVSIINQQLSSASAEAIRERLFDRFEVTPDAVIEADEDALRETGLSRRKIEYIRNIAEAFQRGEIRPARFEGMADEAVIDELTGIKGVGDWTAKMFCMFCLGREDVFPVEDLGLRKGMWTLYGEDLDRDGMYEKAKRWRPYRSYASRYLWRVYDG